MKTVANTTVTIENGFHPGRFLPYGEVFMSDSPYIVKSRDDLAALLPTSAEIKSICELGCANGNNLIYFGRLFNVPRSRLHGIDSCQTEGVQDDKFLFVHSSVEKWLNECCEKFDLIILSDVLEHLYNPWEALSQIKTRLENNGILLISVPNLQNLNILKAIHSGEFFYQQSGLLDQTHIRFFTLHTITRYLRDAGYVTTAFAFRPDQSLLTLKKSVMERVSNDNSIQLNFEGFTLNLNPGAIESHFGQQILVAAKKSE